MKMFNRIALATALLVPAAAAPASAQSWKWDLGFNAGYGLFTNSITEDSLAADNDVKFKNKPRFGATLGYWFNDKIGLRGNYKFMGTEVQNKDTDATLLDGINMHSGSADLLFRLGSVPETYMGGEFLPYLALGLGAKWANARGDDSLCRDTVTDEGPAEWSCAAFVAAPGQLVALAEDKTIMGLVGLGADYRFSRGMALSIELNDRMFRPGFARAAGPVGTSDGVRVYNMPNGDHRISKLTHEFGADIGLKFLFGVKEAAVVAVMPPPPPPPAPPAVMPPPPPPPAPVENAIQVCVVDPAQPNGLRMVNAIYLPASGDTMVMSNGSRVALSSTVGNVMVVRNADWYVRGEPLTINIGKNKMQYGTFEGAKMIESGRLSYIGNVGGYPVYADRDEVADVNNALAELRRANAARDLGDILDERKDLRDQLDDVKFLYVPLQPTGCVFQTFQVIEQVKKGK
jgi:opacity protein-like surface antigen